MVETRPPASLPVQLAEPLIFTWSGGLYFQASFGFRWLFHDGSFLIDPRLSLN